MEGLAKGVYESHVEGVRDRGSLCSRGLDGVNKL